MRIIKLTSEDDAAQSDQMIELLTKQMQVIGSESAPQRIKSGLENILKPDSPAYIFVTLDSSDTPIAFCLVNIGRGLDSGGDYLWLNEIYVEENCRKQSIGKNLLKYVMNWAREKNCRAVCSMIALSNQAVQRLCASLGFELTDNIWLQKDL